MKKLLATVALTVAGMAVTASPASALRGTAVVVVSAAVDCIVCDPTEDTIDVVSVAVDRTIE